MYNINIDDNKKRVYIRPEDVLELLVTNIKNKKWVGMDQIEENVSKMLLYFKKSNKYLNAYYIKDVYGTKRDKDIDSDG